MSSNKWSYFEEKTTLKKHLGRMGWCALQLNLFAFKQSMQLNFKLFFIVLVEVETKVNPITEI